MTYNVSGGTLSLTQSINPGYVLLNHRHSQGCSGCTCTPRAEKKIRRNLQEKNVSAPLPSIPSVPPSRQWKSHFRIFLDLEVEVVDLVVLDRLPRATSKKGGQLFEEKAHPGQNPGYAYVLNYVCGLPHKISD